MKYNYFISAITSISHSTPLGSSFTATQERAGFFHRGGVAFVKAFFQSTAPRLGTTDQTVVQAFHLLNNFDIPVGIQFLDPELIPDMPSATQITIATDLQHQRLFYRTMYNAAIRCIDLRKIDFDRVNFQAEPLEISREQPIEMIEVY